MKEEAKYFNQMFLFLSPLINNVKQTAVQKDSEITEEVLFDLIKAFKSGKIPGLDGRAVEEYQTLLMYSEDRH